MTPVELADNAREHLVDTLEDLRAELRGELGLADGASLPDPLPDDASERAEELQARLEAWESLNPRVIGALEFSQELVDGLRRLPTLAVLPLGDDIDPDLAPEGTATLQHVRTTVGVVIVVASRNDRGGSKQAAGDGALRRLQTALRERLVGWRPARRWDPLAVRRSRLLDLSGGRASWQEDYTTFGWARQARQ